MTTAAKMDGPEKAVLIVGPGYGALKVAEDLAQSGIPVVWVTRAPHFLELPGGIETLAEWPDDLNFQFRPLYLRVTRHSLVTPLTRARIESIERIQDDYRANIVQDPMYVDYDLCTGCGRCIEVCPLNESEQPPLTRTPAYCPSRALDLDKRKLSRCRESCPLGVNVQAYMALTAQARFDEALAVIKDDNPLPGVCGRVCHHPCEESCRRAELDQAVAIRDIKRFLADHEARGRQPRLDIPDSPRRPERVAVIGSGPAGLTAAHFLNRAGFPVTIFEAMPEPGGMLRAGINAFRLPRPVLDAEIKAIVDAGVEICTDVMVSSIDNLFSEGFRAVLLCTGAHRDLRLNIPGEDAEGIFGAVEMLKDFNIRQKVKIGEDVAVIGGGNSAVDTARTAIRLGARTVTIYYRRKHEDMPAEEFEITAAQEEGVQIEYLTAPVRVIVEEGKVTGLDLTRMRLGEIDSSGRGRPEPIEGSEFSVKANTVIVAISQEPDLEETGLGGEFEKGRGGRVIVDERCSTSRKGVFAAGDVVTGPSTVIGSMADGRMAAGRAIEYLTGEPSAFVKLSAESRGVGDYLDISEDTPRQWRPEMAQRQPKVRCRDFEEVSFGLTAEQAVAEAQRCIQCGLCCECRVCETACAEIGAIDHFRPTRSIEVLSPGIVVADADEMPQKNDLGDERIYRLGDFQHTTDLMNVMVAGSAAAGQVMAHAAVLRTEVVPEEPKPPEISEELRLGVFVCTCNGTMAPSGALERIRELVADVPGVEHCELIFSACHPRGSDQIARAVKEHRLTRVIMASCICCPLDFHCISCNDQRTRAKKHLFDRLGLSRSDFDMINIKDHLHPEGKSEDEIVERARYLLRGAFIRARFLGPLRQGTTEIGSRILILGGSEVGISCALNLDNQGFRVRLVHRCRIKDGPEPPKSVLKRPVDLTQGRSITHVEEAVIEEIRGNVGDFTVILGEEGPQHRWRADIICLTDEHLLPLAVHEHMMGLKKLYRYDFAFFHTPQLGLYRVMPRTLKRVTAFEAGAALAAQVARATAEAFMKDHELSPRVDPELCRGCGRCADICLFDAIKMVADAQGVFTAEVLRYNCVGCGGCVGRCPVTALNMPYFSNQLAEEIMVGTLAGER